MTKYRKQLLKGSSADDVKQKIYDFCNSKGYSVIAMETDKDHIHFLISYDAADRVCDIVKTIKQRLRTIFGRNIQTSQVSNIGKRKSFDLMVTLLVV